jgi:DNA-binding response OmpR family regulator
LDFAVAGARCKARHYATPPIQGVVATARRANALPSDWVLTEEWLERTAPPLSKTELAVLRCLMKNESRWLTSDTIIAASLKTAHTSDTSLVRVHVHAIRKKLGALGEHVQSRRGLGYRFLSSIRRPNAAMPTWSKGQRDEVSAQKRQHVDFTVASCTVLRDATCACQGLSTVRGSDAPPSYGALNESLIEETALPLSKTELAVLRCLMKNDSRWLTSETIIAASLGTAHTSDTSLVRVHVHAIRKKLGELGKHVQSRRGLGYRFLSSLHGPNTAMPVVRE